MSKTPSEKMKAFDALIDFSNDIKAQKLPFVIIVGLPETGEIVRLCYGMESAPNREIFGAEFTELLSREEKRSKS